LGRADDIGTVGYAMPSIAVPRLSDVPKPPAFEPSTHKQLLPSISARSRAELGQRFWNISRWRDGDFTGV